LSLTAKTTSPALSTSPPTASTSSATSASALTLVPSHLRRTS
jgi:hypothetical protein